MIVAARFLAAAMLCLCPSIALAGEMEERDAVALEAKADFLAGRFGELEKARDRYLSPTEKTSSGSSKIMFFYSAFNTSTLYGEPAKVSDERFRKQARRWVRAFPKSTAAAIASMQSWRETAWLIRGDGLADTVSDEQWKGFRANLAKAMAPLKRVAKTSQNDPEWYERRLTLALETGEKWDVFAAVATEGLARHPESLDIQHALLRAFLPQWNGSYEALDAGVEQIVALTSKTSGQEFYARSYAWLREVQLTRTLFRESKASWPRMKTGFDDLLARYPTDWNLNIFAMHACIANDSDTLAAVLKRLDGRLVDTVWKDARFMAFCAAAPKRQQIGAEDAAHFSKPAPAPDERIARNAIVAAVADDFIAGRFDRLDATHDEMLANKTTTPSGAWKLEFFYEGLAPQRMLYEPGGRVDQPNLEKVRAQTNAWLAASPSSKAATIALARLAFFEAKTLRYSRSQTAQTAEQQSARATEQLAAARKLLEDSRALASSDPEWWTNVVRVSHALRSDKASFDALVSQAMAVEPTYPPLLSAILARAWAPEPLATVPEIIQTVATASSARQASEVYARSALWVAEFDKRPDVINVMKLDWETAKAGLDTLIERYPSQWNLNAYANLACMARDRPTATTLIARIGDRVVEDRWSNWRWPKSCTDWVAGRTADFIQ